MTAEAAALVAAPPVRVVERADAAAVVSVTGGAPVAREEREGGADLGALWDSVRGLVAKSAAQSSFVELFELKAVRGGVAEVVVRDPGKLVIAKSQLGLVSGLLSKASGVSMTARLLEGASGGGAAEAGVAGGAGGAGGAAPGGSAAARMVQVDAATRNQAMEQPLVKKAVDLFGARLIGVEEDVG